MKYPPELPGLAFHALLHLLIIGTLVALHVWIRRRRGRSYRDLIMR